MSFVSNLNEPLFEESEDHSALISAVMSKAKQTTAEMIHARLQFIVSPRNKEYNTLKIDPLSVCVVPLAMSFSGMFIYIIIVSDPIFGDYD